MAEKRRLLCIVLRRIEYEFVRRWKVERFFDQLTECLTGFHYHPQLIRVSQFGQIANFDFVQYIVVLNGLIEPEVVISDPKYVTGKKKRVAPGLSSERESIRYQNNLLMIQNQCSFFLA